MKKKYTNEDIDAIIVELTEAFELATQTYKLALSGRDSNRAKKELLRENTRGTVVNRYQCDFAWILHDIKTGPICFIEDNIEKGYELIIHLKKISET